MCIFLTVSVLYQLHTVLKTALLSVDGIHDHLVTIAFLFRRESTTPRIYTVDCVMVDMGFVELLL